MLVLVTQSRPSFLQIRGLYPTELLCPWSCAGKNTGVGSHSLLQGNLRDPGIKPWSPALAGIFFTLCVTRAAHFCTYLYDHVYQRGLCLLTISNYEHPEERTLIYFHDLSRMFSIYLVLKNNSWIIEVLSDDLYISILER